MVPTDGSATAKLHHLAGRGQGDGLIFHHGDNGSGGKRGATRAPNNNEML